MPSYVVRYRPGCTRTEEVVEADELRREAGWLVLRREVLVVGRLRSVVALRVHVSDVRGVRRAAAGRAESALPRRTGAGEAGRRRVSGGRP